MDIFLSVDWQFGCVKLRVCTLQAITDRLRAAGTSPKVVMGAPTGEVMQSAKSLQQLPVGPQPPSGSARVVGGGTVQVNHISKGLSELYQCLNDDHIHNASLMPDRAQGGICTDEGSHDGD